MPDCRQHAESTADKHKFTLNTRAGLAVATDNRLFDYTHVEAVKRLAHEKSAQTRYEDFVERVTIDLNLPVPNAPRLRRASANVTNGKRWISVLPG